MQKLVLSLFITALLVGALSHSVHAIPQFHKEFVNLYCKEDGSAKKGSDKKGSDKKPAASGKKSGEPTTNLKEIATGKKTKCFVCHQGKKKKNLNRYGQQLSKLLDKKEDKKDVKKIVASLQKVAAMHIDPKDDKSPTFGDLIKVNKAPGGSLEEVSKEPKKEESAG